MSEGFQWYAHEKNKANFTRASTKASYVSVQSPLSPKEYEIIEGEYYTPFSGRFESEEQAKDYMTRNGEFWASRGIKLVLLKNCNNRTD